MPFAADRILIKKAFTNRLFQPVNIAPLIVFRIFFGFLLFYHAVSTLLNGTIYQNYIAPAFTFAYVGLEFLQPLPGSGMYLYVAFMALLALLIMLGAWYRIAMCSYAILWTYLYLIQKSGYNNHYYLVLLISWIMVFMPANRLYAFDAKRNPTISSATCPQYCIWIFIFQLAVMYFFAAISKITPDWFSGKFIAIQFSRLSEHPVLGLLYGQKWFQLFICYAGFLFDLLIVPLLLFKKTRNLAFLLSCLFHLFNSYTFKLGIFPYLSLAFLVFFFEAATIEKIFFKRKPVIHKQVERFEFSLLKRKLIITCLGIYALFQLLLPLHPWIFSGNVFWTEEGYRLSWKMMLRTKSGRIHFKVFDPESKQTWKEDPGKKFALAHLRTLATSPDIILQYAHRLKKEYTSKGYPKVQVFAIGEVSLNRNTARPLVDSTVDLATIKWQPFRHSDWITAY